MPSAPIPRVPFIDQRGILTTAGVYYLNQLVLAQGDIGTIRSDVSALTATVTAIQASIAALQASVNSINGAITALQASQAAADAAIAVLQTTVAANSAAIAAIEASVAAIDPDGSVMAPVDIGPVLARIRNLEGLGVAA